MEGNRISIQRQQYTQRSTIGELFLNDSNFCYTLEDVVRPPGIKVPGQTAIPAGQYRVTVDRSARFGRYMFHVLDVPSFAGIRIHSGNTDKDTEGCILVGYNRSQDAIGDSRAALADLWQQLVVETGAIDDHGIPIVKLAQPLTLEIFDAAAALEKEGVV